MLCSLCSSQLIGLLNDIYIPAAIPFYNKLQRLIVEDKERLDVLVVDIASFGGHMIAELSKLPTIINSPTLLPTLTSTNYPSWGSGYRREMTWWESCLNIFQVSGSQLRSDEIAFISDIVNTTSH